MKTAADPAGLDPYLKAELQRASDRIARGILPTMEERKAAAARTDRMREENARLFGIRDVTLDAVRVPRGLMKYVIDTSVDIKTYVQESDSGTAVRLRNDYHRGAHELIAPDIFPTEMCNVLVILERSGKIKAGDAEQFFGQFLGQLPPLVAAIPLLPRALEIAKQFRQTVYDCLYVALAEREGCELVTADDKLVNAVQSVLSFVVPLSSLP